MVLERPKLAPHRDAIRDSLAAALGSVNVKFTTGEKMGFVGREEGAAALAVATLEPTGALGRAHARAAALGGGAAQLLVLDLALELLQRAAQVPAHGRGGDLVGEPARDARAGDAVGEPQRGDRACGPRRPARSRQRPRWSMPVIDVQARSAARANSTTSISPPTSAEPTRSSIR